MMVHGSRRGAVAVFAGMACLALAVPAQAGARGVKYDADGAAIVVANDRYEVSFSKKNGAIEGIVDKQSGRAVCLGGELWEVSGFQGKRARGSEYDAATGAFRPTWDARKQTLTFDFKPPQASGSRLDAQAVLTFSDQSYFDLQLRIENHLGDRLHFVELPQTLRMKGDEIQEALLPVLPGIRFNRRFFQERRSWLHGHYPRNTVFADYVWFRSDGGTLAMYSVLVEDVTPVVWRRLAAEGDVYAWHHGYNVAVPDGATWKSPKVRIQVGLGAFPATEAYRKDTGMAAGPSLRTKLGAQYPKLAGMLSMKTGIESILMEFNWRLTDREEYRKLWAGLPAPTLLFVTGYNRGGQDENNPDIFPVDAKFGTDEDFKAVLQMARKEGHFVMPYVNPTFWDDQSETARGLAVKDYAAMYQESGANLENYAGHGGYPVCAQAPAVKERLRRLMNDVKAKIPIDFVWEDQVGSRFMPDFNPHNPNPVLHAQGWLEHTRLYQKMGLMAEHGHDRMVKSHVGFQGNVILYENGGGFGDREWGTGTWEYYPLVPAMARDKIFFYNAPDQFIQTKRMLTWTLAMAQMPTNDLHRHTLNSAWHKTSAALQRYVLAKYADELVAGYEKVEEDVTRTRFKTFEVVANWSKAKTYVTGLHEVVPEGFLVTSDEGNVTAGVFSRFNGDALATGDHYLIEIRLPGKIVIYHPQGPDTPLTVDSKAWGLAAVRAITKEGSVEVPCEALNDGRVRFGWKGALDGKEVLSCEITVSEDPAHPAGE